MDKNATPSSNYPVDHVDWLSHGHKLCDHQSPNSLQWEPNSLESGWKSVPVGTLKFGWSDGWVVQTSQNGSLNITGIKMSFSFETGVIFVLGFGFSVVFLGGGGCEGYFFTLPEQC